MAKKIFWRIVPVYLSDDNVDGPAYAIINLDAAQIKRIRQLAKAVKDLKVTYINEWDSSPEMMNSELDLGGHTFSEENPWKVVTDRTSMKKLGLLVNHENELVRIMVKQRLSGYSVHSQETLQEIRAHMKEYEESLEAQLLEVSSNDFHYSGYLKHTDIRYSTEGIPLKDLPKLI
jgi:hypothetical protein